MRDMPLLTFFDAPLDHIVFYMGAALVDSDSIGVPARDYVPQNQSCYESVECSGLLEQLRYVGGCFRHCLRNL